MKEGEEKGKEKEEGKMEKGKMGKWRNWEEIGDN